MGRAVKTEKATLWLAVALLAAVGLLPLVLVVARSFFVEGQLSLAFYRNLLGSAGTWPTLGNSLTLAFLTAFVATAIGLPLGVLLGKTDLPLRSGFAALFTLPLLVPPYITAISWFHVLGRDGSMAAWLGPAAGARTSDWLFGLPGCVLVLTSAYLPVVLLLTIAFVRGVNPRLEEAGRLVSGWGKLLLKITIPLIAPGVLLGSLLVFLLTLGEFGVPMFLRYNVYAVESFTQFAAFYNVGAATATAVPLAVITLLVLSLERLFLRKRTYQIQPGYNAAGPITIRLGRFRPVAFLFVAALCVVMVIAPLAILVIHSQSPATYREAFIRSGDALLRSIVYAAAGASLLTLFGFLIGYLVQHRTLPVWRSVDSTTILLFAMPSTVIGIGLVSLWNRPSLGFVYGTPAIIILGYLAKYTVLTSRTTVSTLAQIPPSMEEAARIVGAGWFRRVTQIVTPLAARGLTAAWLIGYLFCLRDMGITMMVYPPGGDTLPVRMFTLMANSPPQLIAAISVIMVVATLLPLATVGWLLTSGRRLAHANR